MKGVVKLKWSVGDDKWHALLPDGTFVYDFFDCANFNRMFDQPDKKKEEWFVIDIKRYKFKGGQHDL